MVSVSNARASWRGFSGSANYVATNLSSPEIKNNDSMYSYVKWQTSSKSGHRMWFTLKDVNKNAKGKILLSEPTGKEEKFKTDTYEDSKYHL